MADNKKKVREDKRRVALGQDYERRYIIERLEAASAHLAMADLQLEAVATRLRDGFHAASKASKRRGK